MLRKTICISAALWLATLTAASQSAAIWLDVPFVAQQSKACGAASLSMLMQYWARATNANFSEGADANAIQHALYSKQAGGIHAVDMARYLQSHGFRTFVFRGEWHDLEQHLRKGRPLIVALGESGQGPLHYVVVAGVDPAEQLVLVNDPARRKLLKQDRRAFERQWRATDNWTLLAVPQ